MKLLAIDPGPTNRGNKYRAQKTEVDGIVFASKKEAARYRELRFLQRSGEIDLLETQPKYRLDVNGQTVCTYVADFRYEDRDGKTIVEDVKGVKTRIYRLKKKLMKAIHGIEVKEV